MELGNFFEADSRLVGQEIPRLLWNLNVHYRVLKSPPPVPVPNKLTPVHTLIPYFPNIHFTIILPYTSVSFINI
jgi:hypothetical protein